MATTTPSILDDWDLDDPEDEYAPGCLFPETCCMGYADHFKFECYTPEMYEQYIAELFEQQSG